MAMTEISIAPSEHPVVRRWFEGEHLDLIVWETHFGDMLRFRLLARALGDETEGLYWDKKVGLRHGHLPSSLTEKDWETLGWVNENRAPSEAFLSAWRKEGASLPPLIFRFVQQLLENKALA
ncbi:MAG: hypothetical protein RJB66_2739 [Pseudomonadota bacterium]|jgi:hypothetical protein